MKNKSFITKESLEKGREKMDKIANMEFGSFLIDEEIVYDFSALKPAPPIRYASEKNINS